MTKKQIKEVLDFIVARCNENSDKRCLDCEHRSVCEDAFGFTTLNEEWDTEKIAEEFSDERGEEDGSN